MEPMICIYIYTRYMCCLFIYLSTLFGMILPNGRYLSPGAKTTKQQTLFFLLDQLSFEARNSKSNLNTSFIRDIDAGIVSCPHGGRVKLLSLSFSCFRLRSLILSIVYITRSRLERLDVQTLSMCHKVLFVNETCSECRCNRWAVQIEMFGCYQDAIRCAWKSRQGVDSACLGQCTLMESYGVEIGQWPRFFRSFRYFFGKKNIYLSIYLSISLSLHMHWISLKLRRRFPHCSWGLSGLALVWPTREIGLGGESQRGRYQVPRSTLGRAPVGWRWLWWMPVKWPCLMGKKCWNMLINHQNFGQPIVQANPSVDMFVYVVVNAPLGG